MKILFFQGEFVSDENAPVASNGTICFCHVETDDLIKVSTVTDIINKERGTSKDIVFVPFPFLGSLQGRMQCTQAKGLIEKISKNFPGSVIAPSSKFDTFSLTLAAGVSGKPDNRIKFVQV